MVYLKFKDETKCDFKYDSNKKLVPSKLKSKKINFSKKENEILKIQLSRIEKKDCDTLKITPFKEDESINKMTFDFKYFDFYENKFYKIIIKREKYKKKFIEIIQSKSIKNDFFWKIEVFLIDKKTECIKNKYVTRGLNSNESQDIYNLFKNKKKLKEKVLDLINFHKYNVYEEKNKNKNLELCFERRTNEV